jgi:glycosyltransferase involved in cell wall biosynthesis
MIDPKLASALDHRDQAVRQPALQPNSVLVAHPTLQHAHQLALALHERGWLKALWSGIPVASPDERLAWWIPDKYQRKVKRVGIPASLRAHPVQFQLALRAGRTGLVPFRGGPGDFVHRVFHAFDAWTARRIHRLRPKVVVAYENSAYYTFAAAKAVGARCVLDAASLHHQTSLDLMQGVGTPFEKEVNRRKDAETDMADLILTCSPLAADSYIAHGIPFAKVHPLLLGAELPQGLSERARRTAPPLFIFAGVLSRRKSVDLILSAFKRLASEGFAYELQFVGNLADPALLDQVRNTPFTSYRSGVAQKDLYPLLAEADCLLLPSRFDSFGMVVAEAMACGTPAIVSTQTGAKAIIEDLPGSGWIVEPEGESLYACLRSLIAAPDQLDAARALARRAAEAYTWQAYRKRAAKLFEESLC